MNSTYYTGVGSRSTPKPILSLMAEIAKKMHKKGYTLRSGCADGADSAFEQGAGPHKQLYTPVPQYKGRNGITPDPHAFDIAKQFHPAWGKLSSFAKKLMARNAHQVLGRDLESPSRVLICWTPDGSEGKTSRHTGGTGQAIRIAAASGVPICNLQREHRRKEYTEWVNTPVFPDN